jgi:hypothetical protein
VGDEVEIMQCKVWKLVEIILPERPSLELRLKVFGVVAEAYRAASVRYGQQEAREWADGFTVPPETVLHDEQELEEADHDLAALADRRKGMIADSRLSEVRARETLSRDNPELEKVLELAGIGMPVLVEPAFVDNATEKDSKWPNMRSDYVEVHEAVDRSFYENFVVPGLAVILTEATVRKWLNNVHVSVAGWTEKYGKRAGRPLNDCSSGAAKGMSVLNSDKVKELSNEYWGPPEHPTIRALVQMILRMQNKPGHVLGEGLILWATDVAGAYTKIYFKSSDVRRMAVALIGGLVLFSLVGIFGWTGTPAAFAVITRALLFEFRRQLEGEMEMYVDDTMGCCAESSIEGVMEGVEGIVCGLLGPGALERLKSRAQRRLDMIGYTLDLNTQRVSIAHKNVLRAIYGFSLIGEQTDRIAVKTLEKLSSWASRYGEVCMVMKPYTSLLYSAQRGMNRWGSVVLTDELYRVCRLFQVLLVLSAVDEVKFARPFDAFDVEAGMPSGVVEFDASLFGGGGLIFKVEADGTETVVGGFNLDLRPLGFGTDAGFQNCAEFITAVIGIRAARRAGLDVRRIKLRGDSMSALSWAKGHFRGTQVRAAGCVYVFQAAVYEIEWVRTEFLAGVENTRADKISRGDSWRKMQAQFTELRGLPFWAGEDDVGAQQLIELCDPRYVVKSDEDMANRWHRTLRLLRE